MIFNEIAIFISRLEHPVRIFGFWAFKIKDNTSVTFNKDIFNYGNRKSDSIWVQIESLLAEKAGVLPLNKGKANFSLRGNSLGKGNVAKRQKDCRSWRATPG